MAGFSFPSAAKIASLRARYPVGARVELVSLSDPYPGRLVPGSLGSVAFVDDAGTVHVSWDCGSGLGLVYGEDSFRLVSAAPAAAAPVPVPVPVAAPVAEPAPLSPAAVSAASVRDSVLSVVAEIVGSLNGRLWVPPAAEVPGLFSQSGAAGVVASFDEAFGQVELAFRSIARLAPAAVVTPVLLDLVDAFSAIAGAVADGGLSLCQPAPDDEQCPVCGGSV